MVVIPRQGDDGKSWVNGIQLKQLPASTPPTLKPWSPVDLLMGSILGNRGLSLLTLFLSPLSPLCLPMLLTFTAQISHLKKKLLIIRRFEMT